LVVTFAVLTKDEQPSSSLQDNQSLDEPNEAADSFKDSNPEKTKAPDFVLEDLEGNKVSLSDYIGQNVFLNFWASWCGPCKAEMPDMELIQQSYGDQVVILAVNVGENAATASGFKEDYGLTFEILLDQDNNVARLYSVTGIPTSYFIDKEGNIIAGYVGTMDYDTMVNYISMFD
jgi:thiol-disulfide isomerase/thioredoxin